MVKEESALGHMCVLLLHSLVAILWHNIPTTLLAELLEFIQSAHTFDKLLVHKHYYYNLIVVVILYICHAMLYMKSLMYQM